MNQDAKKTAFRMIPYGISSAWPDAAILEMKDLGDNVFYGGG